MPLRITNRLRAVRDVERRKVEHMSFGSAESTVESIRRPAGPYARWLPRPPKAVTITYNQPPALTAAEIARDAAWRYGRT